MKVTTLSDQSASILPTPPPSSLASTWPFELAATPTVLTAHRNDPSLTILQLAPTLTTLWTSILMFRVLVALDPECPAGGRGSGLSRGLGRGRDDVQEMDCAVTRDRLLKLVDQVEGWYGPLGLCKVSRSLQHVRRWRLGVYQVR